MGTEGIDRQQQKVTEFLRLLPLTLEIAGLPRAEQNKHSDIFAQGRGGGVKSLQRARIATRSAANRMVERRNLYSGQPE